MCGLYIRDISEGGSKGSAMRTVTGLCSVEARERASVEARSSAISPTLSESVTPRSQTPCTISAGAVLSVRHCARVAACACRSFFEVFARKEVCA